MLLAVLLLGIAAAAIGQVITGRGFMMIAAPIAMLTLGWAEGLRIALLFGLMLALVQLLAERPALRTRPLLNILVPAVVATPLWVWLIGLLPDPVAGRLAGVVALLAVAYVLLGSRVPAKQLPAPAGSIVAGAGTAGLVSLGGIGWPVVRWHARGYAETAPRTQALVTGVLGGVFLIALIFMGLPGFVGPAMPVASVAMAGGLIGGGFLAKKKSEVVTEKKGRTGVLALSAIAGTALLLVGPLG